MPQITVGGHAINYRDSGTGDTCVVFVHAFPFNSEMWAGQFDALGERYRCVALDLLGVGGSDAPEDLSHYTMAAFAEQTRAVVDDIGVERIVLVGLSLGGYVAFEFMRRFGDVVAGLALADTRAEADTEEGKEKRTRQQEMVRSGGTGPLIDAFVDALLAEYTRSNKPDVAERTKKLMDNPAAGFIGGLEAMKNRPDSTADLTGISVPTLILVGENDAVTPPELSRNMHERIGGSELVVVPEAGHISNVEAPEAFNGALAAFLRDI